MTNRITSLLKIQYPIISAGMVWCSGWKLAASVSNAGGLGLIGAGSMHPEVLTEHIKKCKTATPHTFGVNVPLMYPQVKEIMDILIEHQVPVVFTSAGNPGQWTAHLKENGIKVVHVVSSLKFALKSQEAGVDAVVAEGFEAGGHNGREETTTLCLLSDVTSHINIPVIAAGGIGSGRAMVAAFALGAEGVQIGSRFAASEESSAHPDFKRLIVEAKEGSTRLMMKSLMPVRLLKNKFFELVEHAESGGATPDELRALLGKGRAKKGMFEGDLAEGELEIGQIASCINKIEPAADILREIWDEFCLTAASLSVLGKSSR